jgi:hypothetical protein
MTVILDLVYYDLYKNEYDELVIEAVADLEDASLPDFTSEPSEYQPGRRRTTYVVGDYEETDVNLDHQQVKNILEQNIVEWYADYDD